jgi:hypothetical protein
MAISNFLNLLYGKNCDKISKSPRLLVYTVQNELQMAPQDADPYFPSSHQR